MKILLLGGNGQVGWQLRRSLAPLGELVVASREGEPCGDLSRHDALRAGVLAARPDVVVNAAAYTAVDRAEDEAELAFEINAVACEALAEATRDIGAWLVHYSSDYVYRGDGTRPWVEGDACEPLGVYGRSKLAGDQAVQRNPKHLVLRTSWLFDTWGGNFLKSILTAAARRDELKVVADQWGAPTRASAIADVTALMLRDGQRRAGVYHVAAAGETNWNAYARFAIEEAAARGLPMRARGDRVLPVTSAEYGARAPRPANSRLDTGKLAANFGLRLAPWQQGVRAVVAELAQSARFAAGLQGIP